MPNPVGATRWVARFEGAIGTESMEALMKSRN